MASAGCMATAAVCTDALPLPKCPTLRKWAEADAQFLRSFTKRGEASGGADDGSRRASTSSFGSVALNDYTQVRQRYLRSYTFTRDMSITEKVKPRLRRCLSSKPEKKVAVDDKQFNWRRQSSSARVSNGCDGSDEKEKKINNKKSREKDEKKWRTTAKKLKKATCSALRSMFCKLLACTTSVDVA